MSGLLRKFLIHTKPERGRITYVVMAEVADRTHSYQLPEEVGSRIIAACFDVLAREVAAGLRTGTITVKRKGAKNGKG